MNLHLLYLSDVNLCCNLRSVIIQTVRTTAIKSEVTQSISSYIVTLYTYKFYKRARICWKSTCKYRILFKKKLKMVQKYCQKYVVFSNRFSYILFFNEWRLLADVYWIFVLSVKMPPNSNVKSFRTILLHIPLFIVIILQVRK